METIQENLYDRPDGLPLATVEEFKSFESDTDRLHILPFSILTGSSDTKESLHKNTNENNLPRSPSILSRPYLRKKLKQSRLAFHPIKNNEKRILSSRKDISKQLNMRCKADRAKLIGWDCWECREYYKNLSLSRENLRKRKNQCSRHRQKYERPNTPEGFWNPEFPETLSYTY
ncbi:PREDICTED: DNA endonuclease RBBP8-like [Vollenhovia emeryi]|uniref:DNA endonuclease RBBP8-like n=1 Tax=Vollenhovia emeryi TaxID=411798 RepID=UPI0005F4E711|nr:PREDICTED: DNA endonuclease RBBP8-like [Vollenhovia emeryi]